MPRLDATDAEIVAILRVHDEMTRRGLRVLVVAEGAWRGAPHDVSVEALRDLTFLGFVGMRDPLRPSVPAAVLAARAAGIRTIMISGDHPETARVIADAAGIVSAAPTPVVTGEDIALADDATLMRLVATSSVFARIAPEQKLRIVAALKRHGHAVAMTGDGINDAPALVAADVGIAVGHATDVAKEVADIVLLKNDFARIVDAIAEGRTVVDNIRKEIAFLLAFSLSEAAVIAMAIVANIPLPLLPAQILFINVFTDGVPGMALAFEPTEPGIMREPPERFRGLFTPLVRRAVAASAVTSAVTLALGMAWLRSHDPHAETLRTFVFAAIGCSGIVSVFALRTLRRPFWRSLHVGNPLLLMAVAVSAAALMLAALTSVGQAAFGFAPLPLEAWALVGAVVIAHVLVIDIVKYCSAPRTPNRTGVLSSS